MISNEIFMYQRSILNIHEPEIMKDVTMVCFPQITRPKKCTHADRSQRRHSANADILESVGLPSTGSYHDMKQLQEGLRMDDIVGGHSATCGGCLKAVATAVSESAADAATRATRAISMAARRIKKMTTPTANKKLQKKMQHRIKRWSVSDSDTDSRWQHGQHSVPRASDACYVRLSSDPAPQPKGTLPVVLPGQWLRQRNAISALTHD